MIEGRIETDKLIELCFENRWLNEATLTQIEKIKDMNDMGAPISEIATVIWMFTDWDSDEDFSRRAIIYTLDHAGFTERVTKSEADHIKDWLGI